MVSVSLSGRSVPHTFEFDSSIVCVCVQLVMPGTWLSDLCQERYEVREKKASKKVTLLRKCFGWFGMELFMLFGLFPDQLNGGIDSDSDYMKIHENECNMGCVIMQRPRGLKAMGSIDSDSD